MVMRNKWDYEIRKITKVGNSFMVALPPKYLARPKLEVGGLVRIVATRKAIIIKPEKRRLNHGTDAD